MPLSCYKIHIALTVLTKSNTILHAATSKSTYLNAIQTNSRNSQSCSKYQNSMQSGTDDIRKQTNKYKWPYNTL